MKKPFYSTFKICVFMLIILGHSLPVVGQRPLTSGPNFVTPPEPNYTPVIIAGSSLVAGAGSYLYLKNRGPKIFVMEHLPTYLLRRNILPTQDAIDLMYDLNPNLNKSDLIRANRKLVNPDFPEIPDAVRIPSVNAIQITTTVPSELLEQIAEFDSMINIFRSEEISIDSSINLKHHNLILKELEQVIGSLAQNNEESNSLTNRFITDLIGVLNQTLDKSNSAKKFSQEEMTLVENISENLSDLLGISSSIIPRLEDSGQLQIRNPFRKESLFLASLKGEFIAFPKTDGMEVLPHSSISDESYSYRNKKENKTMKFAFSVSKLNSNSGPVTKGPGVEGIFTIQYAMPALEGKLETYLDAEGLATYALAELPGVKLLIVVNGVSDENKLVTVATKIIDFNVAFKNTSRAIVNEEKYIVVPIYLTND